MSCGVGRRHGSDLALLWLWHRLAATAPIRPLAWEPPYTAGVALKQTKKMGNLDKVKSILICFSFVLFFVFLPFLGPLLRHMEVPRLGVESELHPPAYARATATWDLSHICNLHHRSRPRSILNPLSLMVPSRIR